MDRIQLTEASEGQDLISWAQSRNIVPTYDGQEKGTSDRKPAEVSSEQVVSKLTEARDQIAAHAAAIGDNEDEDAPRIGGVLKAINAFSRGDRDPTTLSELNRFRPERLLELGLELPNVSAVIDKIAALTGAEAEQIRFGLEYKGSSHDHRHLLTFADSLKGSTTLQFRPVLQSASFWTLISDSSSILHGRVERDNHHNGRIKVSKPFALTREPMGRDVAAESKAWLMEGGAAMGKEYSNEAMIDVLSAVFGVNAEVVRVVFPRLVKKEEFGPARKYSFQSNSPSSVWIMSQVQGRDATLEVTPDGLHLLTF